MKNIIVLILLFLAGLIQIPAQNIEKRIAKKMRLTVSDNVIKGKVIFEAEEDIESFQVIGNQADVKQIAQKSITLSAGFHAQEGSSFLAQVNENRDKLDDNSPQIADLEDNITVYPNPNNGTFKIDLFKNVNSKEGVIIQIFDSNNRKIYEKNEQSSQTVDINLLNVKSGIYLIKIITNNQKELIKRVIIN
jgi:hypothetical protein